MESEAKVNNKGGVGSSSIGLRLCFIDLGKDT